MAKLRIRSDGTSGSTEVFLVAEDGTEVNLLLELQVRSVAWSIDGPDTFGLATLVIEDPIVELATQRFNIIHAESDQPPARL